MLKTKRKVKKYITGVLLVAIALMPQFFGQNSFADGCTSSPCDTTFQVNVRETLAVSITPPASWASGSTGSFLSNTIGVSVVTNSSNGFLANMYSSSNNAATTKTSLANTVNNAKTIETLASSVTCGTGCTNFTANKWGQKVTSSLGTTTVPTTTPTSGTYAAMTTSSSPIVVINASADTGGTTSTSGAAGIDFGALINTNSASGTYTNTVIINVISSPSDNEAPSDPALPTDDTSSHTSGNYGTYSNANNRTVYTSTSTSSGKTTTTTQVTTGDVTSINPLGETTESNIQNGSTLATGLAIAASTAAAGGMLFFILAKRREDDEEDEEQDLQ